MMFHGAASAARWKPGTRESTSVLPATGGQRCVTLKSLEFPPPAMEVSVIESAAGSVIPTEAEGSRAACGAQAQASRLAGLPRLCRDPSMHPEDGARSLHFGRDDGHIRSTFVQRGGSNGPVNI